MFEKKAVSPSHTLNKFKPGMYNIYKPSGPSSHDMVDLIRKLSGEKRVGHAGTLDPFAEGVLIVAVGREHTKQLGKFLKQNKTYRAVIKLGAESDTGDLTGKITKSEHLKGSTLDPEPSPLASYGTGLQKGRTLRFISKVLKKFTGKIEQVPPAFSAIKIKGQKAYELARKGVMPDLKPRQVKIYSIKILKYRWPYLEIETKVSSGTYIRSLAHDIGQVLQTGGYLEKLVRLKVGQFNIKKSIKMG